MKRVLAGMCVALLLFAPVEQLVADTLDISLKDPIVITTSPLSPIVGYGVFTPGATPGDFTGEVATSERLVRMRAERGTIITEDGYSLQVLLLQNDADVMLVQFIGRDPSGKAVHAYMRGLRSKGHVENAGLSELRNYSRAVPTLPSCVPSFQISPRHQPFPHGRLDRMIRTSHARRPSSACLPPRSERLRRAERLK